eukprot:12414761-Alexandrium_andersonii.AAC.1
MSGSTWARRTVSGQTATPTSSRGRNGRNVHGTSASFALSPSAIGPGSCATTSATSRSRPSG